MHEAEKLERQAWEELSGGDPRTFFESVLAPEAVMVVPDVGVLERAEAIDSMATSQPWDLHTLDDMRVIAPREDVAVVVYRARAIRWDDQHVLHITSAYALLDGGWRLLAHQQTAASHPS
ncbi:nuclear transport factor 2 family protein [Demequina sp. SYSU T00192]|uniref:Nuclear transport factor 2 family protein n=1 Tax=Demequina litoralis TaxID=3051660 RepID=A0ABT8G8C8_9MICO|nr:nuclear transport factor 2 family protein [Demequina sp. SYSU T00192]MDN4475388.1 nuclear transport factor 2 family protein [Demequina sp. SYSU T00192]